MKDLYKNLKFAWGYAKESKKYLILLMIANIINVIFGIVTPILSARIIIELTNNDYSRIILVAGAMFLVEFISDLFSYVSSRCSIKVYRNTLSVLEVDLGRNVLKFDRLSSYMIKYFKNIM